MKQRLLFIFCLILAASTVVVGQSRTVTNADLEKFRQARLRADADLRDNYDRLGFPSPEVMAARAEVSARLKTELVERLREERLVNERLAAEYELARSAARPVYYGDSRQSPYDVDRNLDAGAYGTSYYDLGGYFPSGPRRGRGFAIQRERQTQTGYFAGGQFWPQGPQTQVRPLIAIPRIPRRR